MTDQLSNNKAICEGNESALGGVMYILVLSHYESIYVSVHMQAFARIEPELHHMDSPTYSTLPCQARAWERQSNTRIACLASDRQRVRAKQLCRFDKI